MILEFARMCAEQLTHPEFGVNALLTTCPKDQADTEPPPTELHTFCDSEWVHAYEIPENVLKAERATLVLRLASDITPLAIPGNPEIRAQKPEPGLILLYARLKSAKEHNMRVYVRDCSITLRCAERCMHAWFDRTHGKPELRTRNEAFLSGLTNFAHVAYTPEFPGYIAHALVLSGRMTDRWATNISQ